MCGIAGFIDISSGRSVDFKHSLLKSMGDMIFHRGPDQGGVWLSKNGAVGLSHRRLSILDLSPAGSQPMQSQCGRFVIVYNGEVYNYKEIAKSLNIDATKSSDTAVILAAISAWGIKEAVKKMHGMFAFACYDLETEVLVLVRDRMGEKPLYVGCHEGRLLFGSELKALHATYEQRPELDRDALALYLRHGYYPAPYTVYKNIFKLPQASILTLPVEHINEYLAAPNLLIERSEKFWSLNESGKMALDLPAAQMGFQEEFMRVVGREMHSDVPLGAFLSGGVDSSLIVAAMQSQSDDPINTFSIGFEQTEYNEAPFAAAVAKHLGTNHREQIFTASDALSLIPDLANIYDEPFADSSSMPTLIVSKLAREHVTVSLSGDGGDELFGGYSRYRWAISIWQKIEPLPEAVRTNAARLVLFMTFTNQSWTPELIGRFLSKWKLLAMLLSASERQSFYKALISIEHEPQNFILGKVEEPEYVLSKSCLASDSFVFQMMHLDMHGYLPDDILTKVDRASMSTSLETRVPMLDHSLVEKAWQLRKVILSSSTENSKTVLRDMLYQSVPRSLIERPKRGFAIPLREWLCGELKPWADELLDHSRLASEAVFDANKVSKVWRDFSAGKYGAERFLWNVLMFQLWQQTWR